MSNLPILYFHVHVRVEGLGEGVGEGVLGAIENTSPYMKEFQAGNLRYATLQISEAKHVLVSIHETERENNLSSP